MCKVIAIANQKGGVAKTTTTINLGAGLVKSGKKVVLVDADPQGNLTMGLGFPKNLKVTLKSMMENIIMGLEFDPKEAILHHEEGVDLIPSNKLLAGMDMPFFIKNRFSGILVVLEDKIPFRFSIVRVFACDMFNYCHGNHLPFSSLHTSFHKYPEGTF